METKVQKTEQIPSIINISHNCRLDLGYFRNNSFGKQILQSNFKICHNIHFKCTLTVPSFV
jgi:hypothetical protein